MPQYSSYGCSGADGSHDFDVTSLQLFRCVGVEFILRRWGCSCRGDCLRISCDIGIYSVVVFLVPLYVVYVRISIPIYFGR
jgi:hypothetical protein